MVHQIDTRQGTGLTVFDGSREDESKLATTILEFCRTCFHLLNQRLSVKKSNNVFEVEH